ncbi:MAG: nuclear transport factor 2 family protein [Polyangiales bacterium]
MTKDAIHWLLLRRIRAWEEEDLEAIMADYAPDVVHVSPYGRRVGLVAMREANVRYLAEYTGFEVKLARLLVDGDEGAIEWTWSETKRATGERRSADDAIVFVLREGKIAYWREYFDTAK